MRWPSKRATWTPLRLIGPVNGASDSGGHNSVNCEHAVCVTFIWSTCYYTLINRVTGLRLVDRGPYLPVKYGGSARFMGFDV